MEVAVQTRANSKGCEAQSLTSSSRFPKHFKFPNCLKSSSCSHFSFLEYHSVPDILEGERVGNQVDQTVSHYL